MDSETEAVKLNFEDDSSEEFMMATLITLSRGTSSDPRPPFNYVLQLHTYLVLKRPL
jgi:hypothetical protein